MLVTRLVLLLLLLCGLCVIECRGWSAWLSHAAPGNETLFCGGIIRSLTPQHELSILYEKDHSRIYNLIKQHVSQEYHSNQCTATLHNNITIHRQELLWYSTDQREPYITHMWDRQQNKFHLFPFSLGTNYHMTVNLNDMAHDIVVQRTALNNLFVTKHLIHQAVSDSNKQLHQESSSPDHDRTTLRFLSMNIQNFQRSWRRRVEMIQEIIQENEHVDIIGIQEVRLDEARAFDLHQIDLLKLKLSELGFFYFVYQPAMSYIRPYNIGEIQRSEEGLAIFSRYPIIHTDHLLLTRNMSDHLSHQRIVLRAQVKISEWLTVDFMTTHSSLTESERDINIIDVASHYKDSALPKVIVGDFNAEPHESAIKRMVNELQWKDTYLDAINDNISVFNKTFSTDGRYDKRIDYIFAKNADHISCQTKYHKVVGKQHDYGHYILDTSDHWFLFADIEFKRR